MINHLNARPRVFRKEFSDKNSENPSPGVRVRLNPRRVENLRRKIPAQEAPGRAVGGGADIPLITTEQPNHRRRPRPVGKHGAVLDKSLMSERVVGDEYLRASAGSEGDERTVLGFQVPENGFQAEGASQPWNGKGSRRQPVVGFAGEE
nr:hypothetical protein C4D60_Mb07t22100 [Ipomoea batatas]GME19243.1 hypothetical protein C4D60_Mb07t22100 [Ipomoea batatas]